MAPPAPPPPTTNTSTAVVPLGTEKVPDDVNVCTCGAFTVIVNSLSLTFEAASLALIVNVDVVLEPTASNPYNTAPDEVDVKEQPAGKLPDSKE